MRTDVPTLLCLLVLVGCPGGDDKSPPDDTDTPDPSGLSWYTTCGDPVCGGYAGPFDGIDACDGEAVGDPCSSQGQQCDFMDDCNAVLVCSDADPKDQPGGCPISQAEVKRDIAYLEGPDLHAVADEALGMKLAQWRYRWEDPGTTHLGFLIDDAPTSPAVRADGERVDLYGYTSMVLAALQVQQAEIERLKTEIAALKARSATCPPE